MTSPPAGIHRWRNFLKAKIEDPFRSHVGYAGADLGIRDRHSERHREAGTVHLLAVSGFHVGILAVMAGPSEKGNDEDPGDIVLIWSWSCLAGFRPEG